MILKKLNAVLSLLTLLGVLVHVGYIVFAYLTFFYDPVLKKLTAYPFMIAFCLHALLGVVIVLTRGEVKGAGYYPSLNIKTVIQRVSAALMLLLLYFHICMFDLMSAASGQGLWPLWWFLVFLEIMFFAAVIAHISVSFTGALITLGWLSSMEIKKKTDRVAYILGTLIFILTVYAVVKGQIGLFMAGRG